LTYYREAQAPRVKEHPDEPKLEAHRSAIEGALYAARGDRTRARRSYVTALHRFQAIGFKRSASIIACRLLPITDERRYRDYAEQTMRDASPAYWVRARLAQTIAAVPITPAQAEVLRLVADGMTNKQIAATRGISFFRARNSVAELLAAFGARNRAELGKIAAARGIAYGLHDHRRGRVG
jgi:DNA-binding CsgD family transcriptional regulator